MIEMRPQLAEDDPCPTAAFKGLSPIERLMLRTAKVSSGCWEWRGAHSPLGYGNIYLDPSRRAYATHRLSFEFFKGPIPAELEIDHICINPPCCNPEHLRAVTPKENSNYGQHNQHHNKTHCVHGHEFTPENTLISRKRGVRFCRACADRRRTEYKARREAQALRVASEERAA